jgi:chitin synthase
LLSARYDARSQYDGSDTLSLASSEDDHWGPQIGGYNEHNAQYPPPPVGLLLPQDDALQTAQTVDGAELEAMLEMGFDERPSPGNIPNSTYAPRYQLSDGSTTNLLNVSGNGYAPLSLSKPTTGPVPSTGGGGPDGRRDRGERYGPLGPLDPAVRF